MESAAPRPASTVIILRSASTPADAKPPTATSKNDVHNVTAQSTEVFMVRRHGRSGFMAGAHVFPGGAIDASDAALQERCIGRSAEDCAQALGADPDSSEAKRFAISAFVAAYRETFEESALLLGATASSDDRIEAQRALNAGDISFAEVLDRFQVSLDLSRLAPFARWVTPKVEKRRFDAYFFLAQAQPGQHGASDQRETTTSEWLEPTFAINRSEKGEIILPPPTLHTLLYLADKGEGVFQEAAHRVPPTIAPVFHPLEAPTLVLPGDPLHEVAEPALPGPTRFALQNGRWQPASA